MTAIVIYFQVIRENEITTNKLLNVLMKLLGLGVIIIILITIISIIFNMVLGFGEFVITFGIIALIIFFIIKDLTGWF